MSSSTTDSGQRTSHGAAASANDAAVSVVTGRIVGFVTPVIVMACAAAAYWFVYRHQDALPIGIGSNLYPAERMLKGEIVYRDFFMIQTPGILFLNLWLFKLFGVSLLVALKGVLLFKAATVAMTFVVARRVTSWPIALSSALLTFVWLAPGGPFRPAPIQYEMFFILTAVYFVLRWLGDARHIDAFFAGLLVGLVAMFKQNTGLYCLLALVLALIIGDRCPPASLRAIPRWLIEGVRANGRALGAALAGVAVPCAALVVYVLANGALWPMIDNLLIGPLAHGRERFTGYPLPKQALIVGLAMAAALASMSWIEKNAVRLRPAAWFGIAGGAALCGVLAPSSWADNSLYWFQPVLFLVAARVWWRSRRETQVAGQARGYLLVLILFSIAAYLESFPRSVRGLIIGSLPVAFVLLGFLLWRHGNKTEEATGDTRPEPLLNRMFAGQARFGLLVFSILLFIFALKLLVPRFVQREGLSLAFKAQTELTFDRGREVLFPKKEAAEIEATVSFIHARVPDDGYFFAHSLPAINYHFIAGRNSPTTAMGWNEAGTTDHERRRIVDNLKQHDVRVVMTSDQAMKNEHYQPLLDYFAGEFHESARIGKTVFLERNW